MDESNPGGGAVKVMQQGIQHIVAHEGACAVGDDRGKSQLCCGFCHGHDIHGGKISGGAVGDDALTLGDIACVVRDFGIPDVNTDALWGDDGSAARLADAQNEIGLHLCGGVDHQLRGVAEYGGDLQLMQRKFADLIGEKLHGLPCGIDGFAAEGIEAGDEQFFHGATLLCAYYKGQTGEMQGDAALDFFMIRDGNASFCGEMDRFSEQKWQQILLSNCKIHILCYI